MRAKDFSPRQWSESAIQTVIALDGGLPSEAKAIQIVIRNIVSHKHDDELSATQQAAVLRCLNTLAAIQTVTHATS